ncbi:MAG: AI-2E family transporter [Flavobacteriaceae bacterium]
MIREKTPVTAILRIVLLLLVLAWCFYIIQPFIIILVWATIIGVALYPVYKKLLLFFGQKKQKAVTVLFTVIAMAIIVVPSYYLASSLVKTTKITAEKIRTNTLKIPAPKESVREWPLVGENLYEQWSGISDNLENYIRQNQDILLEIGGKLLGGVTGSLAALAIFIISLLISIVFMYNADHSYSAAKKLSAKLLGAPGDEVVEMSRDTIRSVVKGILVVAIIQAFLALLGFELIGLPGAGLWALAALLAGVVQLPMLLVMIPAIAVAFSTADNTTYAIVFAVYIVLVSFSDTFLKPLLLGKGLKTPMVVILIGAIGGLLLHGIVGLFVGPVVLAVVYQLYSYWVDSNEEA